MQKEAQLVPVYVTSQLLTSSWEVIASGDLAKIWLGKQTKAFTLDKNEQSSYE